MADFTFHGVSVPPHAHGEWLSMGFVASPNTSGVVEALKAVRGGRLPAGSREEAKRRIREDMSEDAVGEAMARLIAGRKRRFPGETHAVRCASHRRPRREHAFPQSLPLPRRDARGQVRIPQATAT